MSVQDEVGPSATGWAKYPIYSTPRYAVEAVQWSEEDTENEPTNPAEWGSKESQDFAKSTDQRNQRCENAECSPEEYLGNTRRNMPVLVILRLWATGKSTTAHIQEG